MLDDRCGKDSCNCAARRENPARFNCGNMFKRLVKQPISYTWVQISWNDFLKDDHFDPFAAETRLQDRELPIMTSVEDVGHCVRLSQI